MSRACGTLVLALWLPAVAQAGNITVTSLSDVTDANDGALTLREAITLANETPGPDTIRFPEFFGA